MNLAALLRQLDDKDLATAVRQLPDTALETVGAALPDAALAALVRASLAAAPSAAPAARPRIAKAVPRDENDIDSAVLDAVRAGADRLSLIQKHAHLSGWQTRAALRRLEGHKLIRRTGVKAGTRYAMPAKKVA